MTKITAALCAALAITLVGCANGHPARPGRPRLRTAKQSVATQPVTPAAQSPSPGFASTCKLGYLAGYEEDTGGFYSGGGFYPDTQAGYSEAISAETSIEGATSYPDGGVKVTITDSGAGATLSGFDDAQGSLVNQHAITSGGDLPRFLGPGESDSFVIDLSDLSGVVYVSHKTYLSSYCRVIGSQ